MLRSSRANQVCFLFVIALVSMPHPAGALPPGKSWSAVIDTFMIPGHTYGVAPTRFESDPVGRPLAFVEAIGGIGRDMYVLRWQDNTWVSVDHLGYGTKGLRPVPSPTGTYHLIWGGLVEVVPFHVSLVMSRFEGDRLTTPDTVTTFDYAGLKYAAAASPVRRWAAVEDYYDLRLLYSDAPGTWVEVPVPGQGDRGMALAALDDTTALLAWKDQYPGGPGAGILSGSNWTLIDAPPVNGLLDAVPQLRPRPSGGYWLSWATIDDYIGIASFRDGAWSPAESVLCAYLRPEKHYAQSRAYMSHDDGEYPAVSWMAVSSLNGLTSVCVCVPNDSGFTIAENLPSSEQGLAPVVARDRNEDVWVVWEAPSGMGWAHTYTRAITTTPTVGGVAAKRFLTWTLSEPAPGSWWAVLRAHHAEPFEEVARVRAGPGLAMNWTDFSPPAASLRYRIRRECLDQQYQWVSDEATWTVDVPPSARPVGQLLLRRSSANPSQSLVRLEVLNAPTGSLVVQVFDLRGRLLLHQHGTATGSGYDTIHVDLASTATAPTTGLYFVRAVDATGRVSPSAKVVLLQ